MSCGGAVGLEAWKRRPPRWSARGGDEVTAGERVGAPLGDGGRFDCCVVAGLEEVDVGVELLLVRGDVDAAVGIEGDDGVVLDDDARW